MIKDEHAVACNCKSQDIFGMVTSRWHHFTAAIDIVTLSLPCARSVRRKESRLG